MKKILAAVLASAMVFSLAACSASNSTTAAATTKAAETETQAASTEAPTEATTEEATIDQTPRTITYWDENGTTERQETWAKIIAAFEAKYPWITIDYVPLSQSEYLSKYQAAMEAGETPDTFGCKGSEQSTLCQSGHLVDLSEWYNVWDEKDDMSAATMAVLAKRSGDNGQILLMPRSQNINILWYNQTILDAANVTSDPNDWTWSDWFDALEAIEAVKSTTGADAFVIRGGSGSADALLSYVHDYVGTGVLLGDDGYYTENTEDVAAFIEKYLGTFNVYTNEGCLNYGYQEMTADFDAGKCSMFFHNLGSFANHAAAFGGNGLYDTTTGAALPNDTFGAAHLPYSDLTGKVVQSSSALASGMFDTCPEEERYDAWLWLAFISGHEGNSIFNEEIGQLPTCTTVLEDAWVSEQFHIKMALELSASENYVEFVDINYLPNYSANLKSIQPEIQAVMMKEETATELLQNWTDLVNEMVDENNAG